MNSFAMLRIFLVFIFHEVVPKVVDVDKIEFCTNLKCGSEEAVCGLRAEENGFRIKYFKNECELLKYGCEVDEKYAYGLINKELCGNNEQNETFFNDINDIDKLNLLKENTIVDCNIKCNDDGNSDEDKDDVKVCAIREDGDGYRIRIFKDKCHLNKHNCENDIQFTETDHFICKPDLKFNSNGSDAKFDDLLDIKNNSNATNLVVVNTNMFGEYDDLNEAIDTFFAASHVFDLPIKEIRPFETRRKLLTYAGPINVFVPVIKKPKNVKNGTHYIPTLSSCYHKCPTKCPDTYAPVCGVPGILAREPALIFQNHCFMDVAQCKMYWEDKSSTAHSSSYMETSFLFCMGDEMNAVYRFLPAIRTLQHMGRLKKKGKFRAKLRNFRFLRDFRAGNPNFMG